MNLKTKNLKFIGFNEADFNLIEKYCKKYPNKFPTFQKLLNSKKFISSSEKEYENIEPWIQWPSIYTGLTYSEHKIFRLGDAIHTEKKDLFKLLEEMGVSVGCISPINCKNNLNNSAYFIPDPWTNTPTDGSANSIDIHSVIKIFVNNNSAGSIQLINYLKLFKIILFNIGINKISLLLKLLLLIKKRPWYKAVILDLLLTRIYIKLNKQKKPKFSHLFLNGLAHIQHHYLLSSEFNFTDIKNPQWYSKPGIDAIYQSLEIYDSIFSDLFTYENILISTGISQVFYDRKKFYYRLNNHSEFLGLIGVKFLEVIPKMSRDFEIIFKDSKDLSAAKNILSRLAIHKKLLFSELDERDCSLFVTLTYDDAINDQTHVSTQLNELKAIDHVSLIAIKNGMHSGKGYTFYNGNFADNITIPRDNSHIKIIHDQIINYYKCT